MERRIDASVRADMRQRETPGVSIAVVRDGRIVYARGYGVRNLASKLAVDVNTVFRFGSVSKQFAAAAILQLQREGKLSLHDPVAKWYPHVTRASDLTLGDLLAQVSGIRDYYPLDYVDREMLEPTTEEEIVRRYGSLPLTFDPRTQWEYSNTNYTLAGLIAAKAGGEPISAQIRERILVPLRMSRTFFDDPARRNVADRATGYESLFTDPPHEDAPEAAHWLNTAGSLAGTATDLARWDVALMDHTVLDADSLREMTEARLLMPGSHSTHYGLAQFVVERNGHTLITHSGGTEGFSSYNVLSLDRRYAVAVLTNYVGASPKRIAWHLLEVLDPSLVDKAAAPNPASELEKSTTKQKRARALVARTLAALRTGRLSAALASADFLRYMDANERRRARSALARLGDVHRIGVPNIDTRGGLVEGDVEIFFAGGKRMAEFYITPEGKMSELWLYR